LKIGDVLTIDRKTVAGSARYQVVLDKIFDTRQDAELAKATSADR